MGVLSIVSTPIGNLRDITLRAIETLKNADAVVCEDTRVTGHLLHQLEIPKKKLIALHGYSDAATLDHVLSLLQSDQKIALVSDAGTPAISDPGYLLVSTAREAGIPIEVVPGPSAFLAALSASGLPINQFLYMGFLPLKKGRKTLLASLKEESRTIAFYESVHRIEKTLAEIADALQDQPDRSIVIARELTKLHEEIISLTIADLKDRAKDLTKKGEFVIVLGPKK
ncbi:16S rRNA (cytidine(1402)-2'-O)-methyltransferase [Candidatus Peregrinibacteria bacterium]|nr:16S rRNA (cytidine(1402)-2'-O)-methyltransferase [Candidatus Peregrinibacteria bacterium]